MERDAAIWSLPPAQLQGASWTTLIAGASPSASDRGRTARRPPAPRQDVRTVVDTNCVALAQATRLLTPGMLARDRGHVVNMSSVAGHAAYGGGAAYCGTKHFVAAFTHAARADVAGSSVRVTAVSPGAVRTEFGRVRFRGDEGAAERVYSGIDALTAEDCADAVLWAVTRPPHVQVGDIVLWATRQAAATTFARRPE